MNITNITIALLQLNSYTNKIDINRYCPFSNTKPIIQEKIISDYADDKFKLYELDNGYAIYSINDKNEESFIEGSYNNNSPFYSHQNCELKYLGVGNYIYNNGNKTCDALTNNIINYETKNATYSLSNENNNRLKMTSSGLSTPDPNSTKIIPVEDQNFITIKDEAYFENLVKFPDNINNECGIVALCILLGYYDTFYSDSFIDNNKTYGYGSKNDYFIKQTETEYDNEYNYPCDNWDEMPYTTNALHDYLMDKYMSNLLNIHTPNIGYPMIGINLMETIKYYIQANCSSIFDHYYLKYADYLIGTTKPKEFINRGIPTCLVLSTYKYKDESGNLTNGSFHDVVAYGYKDNCYLVHMGWKSEAKNYTKIIISDSTIFGYCALDCEDFDTWHYHSYNVRTQIGDCEYGICGCGYYEEM